MSSFKFNTCIGFKDIEKKRDGAILTESESYIAPPNNIGLGINKGSSTRNAQSFI